MTPELNTCFPSVWLYKNSNARSRSFMLILTTCRKAIRQRVWIPTRLHTGVGVHPGFGIPNLGYEQAFASQPWLNTGLPTPNQGYTQAFGSLARATHKCLESQTSDPASRQYPPPVWPWIQRGPRVRSDRGQAAVRPLSDRGPTAARRLSNRCQTAVRPRLAF